MVERRRIMAAVALSTVDNPYNPLTEFDSWFQFDMQKGYNSCAYLDRIAITSDQMSTAEEEEEIERAIDEIIKLDPYNMYIKVKEVVET